jgi:hypothetical protein
MGIARQLLGTYAVDTIGVFTQDFTQVFPLARPIKAIVKETAKVMEHPLETGATITDHRIINPVEIELSMVIPSIAYLGVYETIKQYYLNATLLTVQTKSGVYPNQIIASLPHEENPETFSVLTMALTLKQVLFANTQSVQGVKSPAATNTVDRGSQQASPATTAQTSAAKQLFYPKISYASLKNME